MLQTHVNNDIYNKYCLIHNNIARVYSSIKLSRKCPQFTHCKLGLSRLLKEASVTRWVKRCFADPAVPISIPGSVNIFNRKRASIAFHYRPTIVLM